MRTIGLDAFDRSAQATHIGLNQITDQIGLDRKLAWHVLSAVLRVLRDRLRAKSTDEQPRAAHRTSNHERKHGS